MARLTDDAVRELFERSKDDRAIVVGSEVRQLAGEVLQLREVLTEAHEELMNHKAVGFSYFARTKVEQALRGGK